MDLNWVVPRGNASMQVLWPMALFPPRPPFGVTQFGPPGLSPSGHKQRAGFSLSTSCPRRASVCPRRCSVFMGGVLVHHLRLHPSSFAGSGGGLVNPGPVGENVGPLWPSGLGGPRVPGQYVVRWIPVVGRCPYVSEGPCRGGWASVFQRPCTCGHPNSGAASVWSRFSVFVWWVECAGARSG